MDAPIREQSGGRHTLARVYVFTAKKRSDQRARICCHFRDGSLADQLSTIRAGTGAKLR